MQILLVRLALALLCLYFFVCSLSFLATAFRLLSGRHGGKIFGNTELLQEKRRPKAESNDLIL